MGCTASSDVPEDAYLETAGTGTGCFTDKYFTEHQKRMVKESWKMLDNQHIEKGVMIFLRIFSEKPEAKKLFPFRDLEGEELLKSPIFRGHAKRFMHAVGSTINNIDALDVSCAPTLVQLGRKHAAIAEFMEKYTGVFVESIQYVFNEELGEEGSPEVREAWNAVFRFITSKMEEGYNEQMKQNDSQHNGGVKNVVPYPLPSKHENGQGYSNIDLDQSTNIEKLENGSEKQTIISNGNNLFHSLDGNVNHVIRQKDTELKNGINLTIEEAENK